MGVVIIPGGGGGLASDDVNATLANVLAGKTVLASDSNDDVGTGTLPLTSVLADNGGSMVNRGAAGTSLGVNGSYTIPEGYHNGQGVVNQNITVNNDSGNVNLNNPGDTKSYPAGYYPNAHGAKVNVSWYTDLS